MGLAVHLARRFSRGRGVDEDLRQVAMLGLVKAVDRFDPEMGVPFVAFASTTIDGELRRHFRDGTWMVKVPRSAKELHLLVRDAIDQLSQHGGRAPTVDELAQHLGLPPDDILRGLSATAASTVGSLDVPTAADPARARPSEVAVIDRGYADADGRNHMAVLMELLPEREREIVRLRVEDELSQSEIASRMGISQMHVSRLLRRSFEQLRVALEDAP